MKRLLTIEFLKLRTYRLFWILTGLYLLLMVLTMIGFDSFVNNIIKGEGAIDGLRPTFDVNHFPEVWQYLTYISGFFHVIPGVLIIILTTNEYGYRTIRQNVINGLSRSEFLWSKVLMILALSLVSTFLVGLVAFVLGMIHSSPLEMDMMAERTSFLPAFFLQMVGYLLLAFLIGLLVKRAGFAIGILLLYVFVAEKILVYYLPESIEYLMPVEAMDNLIQFPGLDIIFDDVPETPQWREILLALGYCLGLSGLSMWLLKSRDI